MRYAANAKVVTMSLLFFIVSVVGSLGWLATQRLINNARERARERGLVDKAKLQLTSLASWRNVFRVIMVIAGVLFALSLAHPN
jgi:hypothetical protein